MVFDVLEKVNDILNSHDMPDLFSRDIMNALSREYEQHRYTDDDIREVNCTDILSDYKRLICDRDKDGYWVEKGSYSDYGKNINGFPARFSGGLSDVFEGIAEGGDYAKCFDELLRWLRCHDDRKTSKPSHPLRAAVISDEWKHSFYRNKWIKMKPLIEKLGVDFVYILMTDEEVYEMKF